MIKPHSCISSNWKQQGLWDLNPSGLDCLANFWPHALDLGPKSALHWKYQITLHSLSLWINLTDFAPRSTMKSQFFSSKFWLRWHEIWGDHLTFVVHLKLKYVTFFIFSSQKYPPKLRGAIWTGTLEASCDPDSLNSLETLQIFTFESFWRGSPI